jgi:DNA-directed RNA polymerase subunit L
MEVKLAAKGPNYIELELSGIDFGIVGSLQEILNNYDEVEYAGANITHPLLDKIRFVLRTRGNSSPEEVLERGLSELSQTAKNLRAVIEKLLK